MTSLISQYVTLRKRLRSINAVLDPLIELVREAALEQLTVCAVCGLPVLNNRIEKHRRLHRSEKTRMWGSNASDRLKRSHLDGRALVGDQRSIDREDAQAALIVVPVKRGRGRPRLDEVKP